MINFLKADLHMHTTNSNWQFDFLKLKEVIKKDWLRKIVSITNHNYLTINKSFESNWPLWIPWIEVFSVANEKPIHILWYSLNPTVVSSIEITSKISIINLWIKDY